MSAANLNLHQKLLKIADAAGILQKTKAGYNYRYVPEEEIQAKVTAGMQKYGVMLYHSIVPGTLKVQPHTYQKYDKKEKKEITVNEFIVQAESIYKWVNTENPDEFIEVPWILVGQMEDAAQAFGAAETYCNRYFLMKSLQLATSEADPDEYRSKQKEAENYDDNKKQKEAAEELTKKIKEVVDAGTTLIKGGLPKEKVMEIVAKHNEGNQNPSSIKSIEVCEAVLKAFAEVTAPKGKAKTNKTDDTANKGDKE